MFGGVDSRSKVLVGPSDYAHAARLPPVLLELRVFKETVGRANEGENDSVVRNRVPVDRALPVGNVDSVQGGAVGTHDAFFFSLTGRGGETEKVVRPAEKKRREKKGRKKHGIFQVCTG